MNILREKFIEDINNTIFYDYKPEKLVKCPTIIILYISCDPPIDPIIHSWQIDYVKKNISQEAFVEKNKIKIKKTLLYKLIKNESLK